MGANVLETRSFFDFTLDLKADVRFCSKKKKDQSIKLISFLSQHKTLCTHVIVKASNLTAYIYLSAYLVVSNEHSNHFAK